jgi:hypothetical protein
MKFKKDVLTLGLEPNTGSFKSASSVFDLLEI